MILPALFLLGCLAAEPDPAALNAFFEEFTAKRTAMASLKADYVEKSVTEGESEESPGKLLYVRPHRIIRKTRNPETTILIDQRRAYLYEPDIEQVQIFDLRNDPRLDVLYFGFDEDLSKLQDAYDMSLVEKDGLRGLRMTPKFQLHQDPLFEELSIYFEARNLFPQEITVINSDGGRVSYELSNFEVNSTLDPSETQVVLPEGTAVIENDTPRETIGAGGKLLPEARMPETTETDPPQQQIEVHELEPLAPVNPATPAAPAGASK